MVKETVRTRNQYNMFEISSLIQKALRRQDVELAYFAANELIPHYRNYLWKRLLTVSAEDCYDMVTGKIMELHSLDCHRQDIGNRTHIAKAVSILLNARKNRDGDYFACNLLNSRDYKDISKYVQSPRINSLCPTKNGHCIFDIATCFGKAIDALDDIVVGYCVNEMLRYRKFSWNTIIAKSKEIGTEYVVKEIMALKAADEQTKEASIIFHAKAATILLKVSKYGGDSFYNKEFISNESVDLKSYDNRHFRIPDYVFDCHTYIGKARKMTKEMFVVDEQNALTPHRDGEYDKCSWERFFWMCKNGFYIEENVVPRPSKEIMREVDNGTFQYNLF